MGTTGNKEWKKEEKSGYTGRSLNWEVKPEYVPYPWFTSWSFIL